jgi:hypothetical protein
LSWMILSLFPLFRFAFLFGNDYQTKRPMPPLQHRCTSKKRGFSFKRAIEPKERNSNRHLDSGTCNAKTD